MSIRSRILLGCFALTLLTAAMGGYAREVGRGLGTLTTDLYDKSFQAMSYLRSAQVGLMRVKVDLVSPPSDAARANQPAPLADVLFDIAGDLDVARGPGMPEADRASLSRLAASLTGLRNAAETMSSADLLSAIAGMSEDLDVAVEFYAAEGFRQRREAGSMVVATVERTWIATGAALLAALCITAWLARSIVPALRNAVGIADAIAAGRLDNPIPTGGRDETGRLLCALGAMQSAIAAALARIRVLMDEQTTSHASQVAAQHARLDAALSNMSQGLCLFGGDGRLLVFNRRFAEMFGNPEPGATPAEVFAGDNATALLGTREQGAEVLRQLVDGRTIAVAHRDVADGGWVATYEDVTRQREAEARLDHMAHHDALTGLPNRVSLRRHLDGSLVRARRGEGLAVLCLDLDRFKVVNDTLGHAIGDALLREVAARLSGCTRDADLVARLGGDEFAVIQERAGQPDEATALARRLIEVLSAPFELEGHRVVIGASVGIAIAGDGLVHSDALLKGADLALYRAKAEGRGTWAFFEPEMDARMQARRRLELDLRGALSKGELEVFYQPLVESRGRGVSGFEALLRWRHPERGMVSPADFIPLAEEVGLIGEIGAWVLRRACADVASWPGGLKVAVNLSPAQFRNRTLVRDVALALSDSGLPPDRLELEVTEGLLLSNDAGVLATLYEIKDLGVRIAMDDFGTGYSSLSYLQRFPFDKIKIDQSFIRGLGERDDCTAIVRAVIGLGRALGMDVNAEGVETAAQFDALRAEGCGEVQGYLFSRPVPASAIPGLLGADTKAIVDGGPSQVGEGDVVEPTLVTT